MTKATCNFCGKESSNALVGGRGAICAVCVRSMKAQTKGDGSGPFQVITGGANPAA